MKVGIVTLTGSDNYGNVLQNYALQELLKECGCEAETIKNVTKFGHYGSDISTLNKFTPSYVKKYIRNRLNYRYNIKNSGKGILKTALYCKKNADLISNIKAKRKASFSEFVDDFICWSAEILDINVPWTREQIEQYDFFVSGSDQVWNPTYPSTSEINFLQFAPLYKRVTYAPSFGIESIPDVLRQDYAKWLSEIPYLSVREEKGKEIIGELTGRDAKVVCDPTMAISAKKWLDIEKKPAQMPAGEYIMTYFLGDRTKEYDQYIEEIAETNNLKVVHLFDVLDSEGYTISPQEFLYLIHHAKLVCTDSFHGTVFSILMHTNFVTFSRIEDGGTMESRLQTLLSTFSLECRNYCFVSQSDVFDTDFSNVDFVLKENRSNAIRYLENVLKDKEKCQGIEPEQRTVYAQKRNCCGCSACAMTCPKKCIEMKADDEGFLYPVINEMLCVHCGKCEQVCPVIRAEKDGFCSTDIKDCKVAFSKNHAIRKNSSSGGIFTELAKNVLSQDGVVYGAGLSEDWNVVHCGVATEPDLSKLRGSKYVQSTMANSYQEVKRFLKSGKKVYFSGTPCQVAGLHSYLGDDKVENLITQDIICHGVPSPIVWKKYIDTFHNVENVAFRNKKFGWHYFSMSIKHEGKEYAKRLDEDFFLRLFLDNTILRPICYDCPVKKCGSCADITLADCWNLNKMNSQIKDTDDGLSLVILRTEKAQNVWQQVLNNQSVAAADLDTDMVLDSQSAIRESALCNPKRAVFFKAFKTVMFPELMKTWYQDSIIRKTRKKEIFYKTKVKQFLDRRK